MNLRKEIIPTLIGLFLIFSLSGCQFIVDIFKGGVYVGIVMVVVVVVIIIWLLRKINSRN